jgi:hypothetical protein
MERIKIPEWSNLEAFDKFQPSPEEEQNFEDVNRFLNWVLVVILTFVLIVVALTLR